MVHTMQDNTDGIATLYAYQEEMKIAQSMWASDKDEHQVEEDEHQVEENEHQVLGR